MAFSEQYRRQAGLVVQVIPFVTEEDCFALKGGTAINFFIRDLPRLSIDLDLTYLPITDWSTSLGDIGAALKRIATRIKAGLLGSHVREGVLPDEGVVNKLLVRRHNVQVKVEVTPVLRGCVYEPQIRTVTPRVEEAFGFAEAQVVSLADLYAGKMVAALDRQHPRDLFDVSDMLANVRIDDKLRKAFVVYLLSHNRPLNELLTPTRRDISQEFERGFTGMTDVPVSLEELLGVRQNLISEMVEAMPKSHKDMLLSFERGVPAWGCLGVDGVENLPAVRWRLLNLKRLPQTRREKLVQALENALGASRS